MRTKLLRAIVILACAAPGTVWAQSGARVDDLENEIRRLGQDPVLLDANDVLYVQLDDDKAEAQKRALEEALRRHEIRLAEIEAQLRERESALRAKESELRSAAAGRADREREARRLRERVVQLDVERAQAAARAAELAARRGEANALRFRAGGQGGGTAFWGDARSLAPDGGGQFPGFGGRGSSSIVIRSVNGDVTVIRNGEAVDSSRIVKTPDGIQLLDASGAVEQTIPIQIDFADSFDLTIPDVVKAEKRRIIGVQLAPVTDAVRHHTNLTDGRGVMIASLVPGRPAEAAGLKRYDVISSVDGQVVRSIGDVTKVLQSKAAGDTVGVEVQRGSAQMRIEVAIAEAEVVDTGSLPMLQELPLLRERLGATSGLRGFGPGAIAPRIETEMRDVQSMLERVLKEHEARLELHELKFNEMMKERLHELRALEELRELEELDLRNEELREKRNSQDELLGL